MSDEEKRSKLEWLINLWRGAKDIKSRLAVLLNPENPQTTARLSKAQVMFVTYAKASHKFYPEFEPLEIYANELCLTTISEGGKGREEAIRFTGALETSKVLQKMGIMKPEEKEKS